MDVLQNFGVNWAGLIESSITFGILAVVLYIFAYGPVLKILDKRKSMIQKALKDAEDIEQRKTDIQKEYKKVLSEANKEAKNIVQNAIDQTNVISKKITDDAKENATSLVQKAKDEIASEKAQMYDDLKAEITTLLASTIEKVLTDSLTKEEQEKILKKSLERIKAERIKA